MPPDPDPAAQHRWTAVLAVVTLLLVAACLRPPLTSVGPLLGRIEESTGLGSTALGLLGSLPLLAFAVFSPAAAAIASRWGLEATIGVSLLVLTAAVALRPFTGTVGLWLGTAVIGAAIAVGNVLVPALVKQDMSGAAAVATGLYTTSISGSAALGAGLAVPLATVLGGWQAALAVIAVLPLVVALVWLPRVLRARGAGRRTSAPPSAASSTEVAGSALDVLAEAPPPASPPSVWRSGGAWQLTGYFGLQSAVFYTMITWLPTIEGSFGVDARTAGLHLFAYQLLGAGLGLLASWWMSRRTDQRLPALLVCVPVVVGGLGLWLDPDRSLLWVLVCAAGSSSALVVSLAMVTLRTRTARETAAVSGMVQSAGYLVSAAGPLAAGALHSLTGSWTPALLTIVGIALAQAVLAVGVGRPEPVLD